MDPSSLNKLLQRGIKLKDTRPYLGAGEYPAYPFQGMYDQGPPSSGAFQQPMPPPQSFPPQQSGKTPPPQMQYPPPEQYQPHQYGAAPSHNKARKASFSPLSIFAFLFDKISDGWYDLLDRREQRKKRRWEAKKTQWLADLKLSVNQSSMETGENQIKLEINMLLEGSQVDLELLIELLQALQGDSGKKADAGFAAGLVSFITGKDASGFTKKHGALAWIAISIVLIVLLASFLITFLNGYFDLRNNFGDEPAAAMSTQTPEITAAPASPTPQPDAIDAQMDALWNKSLSRPEFIKDLINTGIHEYGSGDFAAAGRYFERAIKEGDEGVSAKNRLAFMLRRGEYTSETYELDTLLRAAASSGDTFALINLALFKAQSDEWDDCLEAISLINPGAADLLDAIAWWQGLSLEDDTEGHLVLALLAKQGLFDASDLHANLDLAKQQYPNLPDALYTQEISGP